MGDNRLSVKVSLVGLDGKTRTADWWVNWHENSPQNITDGIMQLAKQSQLPANYPEENILQDN